MLTSHDLAKDAQLVRVAVKRRVYEMDQDASIVCGERLGYGPVHVHKRSSLPDDHSSTQTRYSYKMQEHCRSLIVRLIRSSRVDQRFLPKLVNRRSEKQRTTNGDRKVVVHYCHGGMAAGEG